MDSHNSSRHPSSYRDPSGFLFYASGILYRQVNRIYEPHYTQLMASGLYQTLTASGRLIPHREVNENLLQDSDWYTTLQPESLPLITYPYEWCFSQLRDAALLTLSVMKAALQKGMILKDATAYNIQFRKANPVFIDTLSFETYAPGQPWVAYRQFCEQFLFPLYLEAYTGVPVSGWLRQYPEGVPAGVCAKLLPWRSRWSLGVRLHVLLPASLQKRARPAALRSRFSERNMQQLTDHLESILKGFTNSRPKPTIWSSYYEETILSQEYLSEKAAQFRSWINAFSNVTVLDLGANDGYFSLLAAEAGNRVIAADMDPACIDSLYQQLQTRPELNITPLVTDVSNPSPGWGFRHRERSSFSDRAGADLVLALALIHHLVIRNNIPMPLLAGYLAELAPHLLIEFIPRDDEKLKALLNGREHLFPDYTEAAFENAFGAYFHMEKRECLPASRRLLYLMRRK